MIQFVKGLSDLLGEVLDSFFERIHLGNQELGLSFDTLKCSLVVNWDGTSVGLEIIENSCIEGKFVIRLGIAELKHMLC